MRIAYLARALNDLAWFEAYYTQVFPAGAASAARHYMAVLNALKAHPNMGELIRDGVRRLPIPRTPFSIVYRIKRDRIEIMRVWDQRGRPEG